MKRTTFALIAGFVVAAAAAAPAQTRPAPAARTAAAPTSIKTLTRADLDALLAQPAKVLLIDVRQPDEISANGGFPVYLSVQADALADHLAAIPRDRAIVTVSNHANRAVRAAEVLAAHGFTVAGAVGSQTYEEAGGTVVHVAPRSARAAQAKEQ